MQYEQMIRPLGFHPVISPIICVRINNITLGQPAPARIISLPGICAIAGARNAEPAAQNAAAANVRLSGEDLAAVNEFGKTVTDPLDDDPLMWNW